MWEKREHDDHIIPLCHRRLLAQRRTNCSRGWRERRKKALTLNEVVRLFLQYEYTYTHIISTPNNRL